MSEPEDLELLAQLDSTSTALTASTGALDEIRDALGLDALTWMHVDQERAETVVLVRELVKQRDAALKRIARALNVVNDPTGEYRRGGSASDAVQDMVYALEGYTQAEDGTWTEGEA